MGIFQIHFFQLHIGIFNLKISNHLWVSQMIQVKVTQNQPSFILNYYDKVIQYFTWV